MKTFWQRFKRGREPVVAVLAALALGGGWMATTAESCGNDAPVKKRDKGSADVLNFPILERHAAGREVVAKAVA